MADVEMKVRAQVVLQVRIAQLIKDEVDNGTLTEAEVFETIHSQLAFIGVRKWGAAQARDLYAMITQRLGEVVSAEGLAKSEPTGRA